MAKQLDLFNEQSLSGIYAPIPLGIHDKRVSQSIRLIKSYARWKPLTLAYSGGKDSDVVRVLCKIAGVPITMVHNSTTIDPPGTLSYVQKQGAIIQRPKKSFFELVQTKGLPSMFRRFCCVYLKEQYIADTLLLGIRSQESVKRAKRYVEPSACRIYSKCARTETILPIVHWGLDDITQFAEDNSITFHPFYYTKGYFDVTSRVGCIGCPLQGDRGKSDFLAYPKFLRRLCRAYSVYVESHKAVNSVYDDILWQLFYSNHGDMKYRQHFDGLFQHESAKTILENYFHIEL